MADAAVQTYIPLYRKYRPQQFDDVVGQTAVIQTLKNAVLGNQVAHAYLLCGPRGTGKTSTARILAKSLNCLKGGPTVTPCHQCDSCLGITNGNGLDVVEIDAASNNSVNDIRELIDTCQFTPMQGGYKIYIIDEVHMLSTAAFNALLKTLEEPPPNVVFIFATTEAHKVLPTIISRCQRFDFSRIRLPELVEHLRKVADSEGIHINEDGLAMVARHAKGGLRDALSMLDQVGVLSHAQPGNVITAEDVTRFLGAVNEETLIDILSAIAEQDAGKLLRLLDSLKQEGMEPRVLVQAMTESIRNLMIAHTCADDNPETTRTLLGVNDSLFENLCKLARKFKKEEFPQFLHKISELDKQLRQTQAPQLWLETGLLELTYRHEMATISDLQQRLTALEQGAPMATGMKAPQAATSPSATIATPAPQPAASTPSSPIANNNVTVATPAPTQPPATQQVQSPPSASTAVTPSSGAIDWSAIVQAIASIPTKAMVQQHAHLIGLDGNVLMVGCSSQGILNTLKVPSKLIHLNKAVEAVTGQSYDVRLEVGTVPSVGNIPPAPQPQANPVPASPSAAVSIPVPAMTSQTPQQAEAPIASDTPPPPSPKRPALMLDDMPISVNNTPVSQTTSTLPAMPEQNEQASESNVLSPTDMNFTPEDIAEAKSHVATLLQGKEI